MPRHLRRNLSYADALVGKGWFLSYFPPFKTCVPLKFAPSLLQNGYSKPVIIWEVHYCNWLCNYLTKTEIICTNLAQWFCTKLVTHSTHTSSCFDFKWAIVDWIYIAVLFEIWIKLIQQCYFGSAQNTR